MKFKLSKFGFYILCVLIIFAIVFFALRPTYHALNSKVAQIKDKYISLVQEKTGIELKIGKVSPKILLGIDLKNVCAIDSFSGKTIISIKKVNVKYRLLSLLKSDKESLLDDLLKSVTVVDSEIHFCFEENKQLQNKLIEFFADLSDADGHEKASDAVDGTLEADDTTADTSDADGHEKASDKKFVLPCPVKVKNLAILYSQNAVSAKVNLKKIQLSPIIDAATKKNSTSIDISGKINIDAKLNLGAKTNAFESQVSFDSGFSSKIVLSENFDGSIAVLQFSTSDSNIFSLFDLNFALKYKNNAFSALIFDSASPFDFRLEYNLETNDAFAVLNAENFDPFTLLTIKDKNSIIQNAKGSLLSGFYSASYNLKSTQLLYELNGKIHLPKSLSKIDIDANYNIRGDLDTVNVKNFYVTSQLFEGEYQGTFDIKALVPEGELFAYRVELPSEKQMSFEMYFSPLSKGFLCFVPQLIIGDDFLTALELTCIINKGSVDYDFKAYDYSHYEYELPGIIDLNGSFFFDGEKYLQAGISFENFFLGSLAKIASNFVEDDAALVSLSNGFISPYIMSLDLYALTDLKSISFNLPYAIVANTKKDGEMLLLSADGNESTLQVSKFELALGGQTLSATISADLVNNFENCFFSTSFLLNQIPYSFFGAFAKNESLVISGDYGVNVDIDLSDKSKIDGSLIAENVPLALSKYIFTSTLNSSFSFAGLNDWNVSLNDFSVAEDSGNLANSPSFALSGQINNLGAQFDKVQIKDSISVLQGTASSNWNIEGKVLESAFYVLDLQSDILHESINFDLACSNPFMVEFGNEDFWSNLYLTGTGNIKSLYVSHFLQEQDISNTINTNVSILGPLNNPMINAEIENISISIGKKNFYLNGGIAFEDFIFSCKDLNASFLSFNVNNLIGSFNTKSFSGALNGKANIDAGSMQVDAPFVLDFTPLQEGKADNFIARLNFTEVKSSFAEAIKNYPITVVKTQGQTNFSVGPNDSITGYFLSDGKAYAFSKKDFPILFDMKGEFHGLNVDMTVSNIDFDLSKIKNIFPKEIIELNSCKIVGNFTMQGLFTDPEFNGTLYVNDVDVCVPKFMPDSIKAVSIPIVANDNSFKIDEVILTSNKSKIAFNAFLELDRWELSNMLVHINTLQNDSFAVDAVLPFVNLRANTSCNLTMDMSSNHLSLTGSVDTDDTVLVLTLENAAEKAAKSSNNSGFSFGMDLIVNVNAKSKIFYPSEENPIIRGLVFAREPIHLVLNTLTGDFLLNGELVLRGGEMMYLDRNFYLKEGQVTFKETEALFDPTITFRAEIPERDEYGNIIKIILKSDGQRLSTLNPILTSDPAKSTEELRSLLGQVIFGDNVGSVEAALGQLAATGVNYLVQTSVFRQVENRLRDFFNFDIFSFRTEFFRQAIILALDANNSTNPVSAGNYFDNTTVYIGKYIGTTLYFDALLRLVYEDDLSSINSQGKLIFQPELGLELPTPFANIRWSIVPDITTAQNLWVPDSSISLSWKFSF